VAVLWHNPDCAESRAALALLMERGKPFAVREYLKEPPTFSELATLKQHLGPPIEWVRTMEDTWLEHFDHKTIYDDLLPDDDDILRALVTLPLMMERPILSHEGRSVIGKPPEAMLKLLESAPATAEGQAKADAALASLSVAVAAALERGVEAGTVERSLLRLAAELQKS